MPSQSECFECFIKFQQVNNMQKLSIARKLLVSVLAVTAAFAANAATCKNGSFTTIEKIARFEECQAEPGIDSVVGFLNRSVTLGLYVKTTPQAFVWNGIKAVFRQSHPNSIFILNPGQTEYQELPVQLLEGKTKFYTHQEDRSLKPAYSPNAAYVKLKVLDGILMLYVEDYDFDRRINTITCIEAAGCRNQNDDRASYPDLNRTFMY